MSRVDFPGVGRPGDGNDNPVAQALATPAIGERCGDLLAQPRDRRQRRTHEIVRHVAFVSKVDPRLDQRERFDQGPAPRLGAVADQTLELAERLPPLRRRLRRDQVGKAFHGGEIDTAVLERAARELACSAGRTFDPSERVEHRGYNRVGRRGRICSSAISSPVSLCGAGNQSASASSRTSPFSGSRTRARDAWRGCGTRPISFSSPHSPRSADAHHRNRRRRPAGGEGEDRGA